MRDQPLRAPLPKNGSAALWPPLWRVRLQFAELFRAEAAAFLRMHLQRLAGGSTRQRRPKKTPAREKSALARRPASSPARNSVDKRRELFRPADILFKGGSIFFAEVSVKRGNIEDHEPGQRQRRDESRVGAGPIKNRAYYR